MVCTKEGLRKLEGDACTAEIALAVRAIRAPGINQGVSLGKFRRWLVMISNNDVDAERFCVCHFFGVGTAAVGSDDERGIPGFDFIDRVPAKPTCIVNTMGDIVIELVAWGL